LTAALEELLRGRGRGRFALERRAVPWSPLAALALPAACVYGCAMGSFAERPLQAVYSGLKVPLLLGLASAVCLPSFYALNAVLGLRDDFAAALRGVLAAAATVAVTLASLAPCVLFLYASSRDYRFAVVANGALFLVATLAGQWTLARHYRPLIAKDAKHRLARASWLVLYAFVAIQLAWVLRPFVGTPDLPPQLFRREAWSNAYVIVARTVWELVSGRS
jgi:hypothetical protein